MEEPGGVQLQSQQVSRPRQKDQDLTLIQPKVEDPIKNKLKQEVLEALLSGRVFV
jgi:hypothetical protein